MGENRGLRSTVGPFTPVGSGGGKRSVWVTDPLSHVQLPSASEFEKVVVAKNIETPSEVVLNSKAHQRPILEYTFLKAKYKVQ